MTARQPGPWDLPAAGAHIHLVGIAGAGMRGLGLLLDAAGYRISGCDRSGIEDLAELSARARLAAEHDPAHVEEADLVVHTSAVPAEHPELLAAAGLGVPTMKRSRALAALLNERRLVAVAGTHGKTSITALAGLACAAAGLDPIVAVGGRVAPWRGFARSGTGEVAVVEADEYDRSFLDLTYEQEVKQRIQAALISKKILSSCRCRRLWQFQSQFLQSIINRHSFSFLF